MSWLAAILLLAAVPERVVLLDETIQVPAAGWRDFAITLRQRPAAIDCRFEVSGGSGVRAMLIRQQDVVRVRERLPYRPVAGTGFVRSGTLAVAPPVPGDYALVLDNAMEGRRATQVHLTLSLVFAARNPEPYELPPGKRLLIITLSLLFLFAVTLYVLRRLRAALLNPQHRPPGF